MAAFRSALIAAGLVAESKTDERNSSARISPAQLDELSIAFAEHVRVIQQPGRSTEGCASFSVKYDSANDGEKLVESTMGSSTRALTLVNFDAFLRACLQRLEGK